MPPFASNMLEMEHAANSRQQLTAWPNAWRGANRNLAMQDFQTPSEGSIQAGCERDVLR